MRSIPNSAMRADFAAFVARARELGLEVALDLALQCAPDHPWVTEHPEWFTTLPDGSIAYAENPPKKYQDIYPLNFDNDPDGLYAECLRITLLWVKRGVKIFRVDNPHTKPLDFWQWLIAAVKKKHPDVLFLAEAFTRPAMMHELARIGFTQSYTYFTWRNSAWELQQYGEELVAAADYMRPNFFTNTPDILNEFLVHGGQIRLCHQGGACLDDVADVRDLLRLRAVRERAGAAGQRGVPELREVPAAAPRPRRGDRTR